MDVAAVAPVIQEAGADLAVGMAGMTSELVIAWEATDSFTMLYWNVCEALFKTRKRAAPYFGPSKFPSSDRIF